MPAFSRIHQRIHALVIHGGKVRPQLGQFFHHRDLPLLCRIHQRGFTGIIFGLGIIALGHQEVGNFRLSALGRIHQHRLTESIFLPHIRAFIHQALKVRPIPLTGIEHEQGFPVIPLIINFFQPAFKHFRQLGEFLHFLGHHHHRDMTAGIFLPDIHPVVQEVICRLHIPFPQGINQQTAFL